MAPRPHTADASRLPLPGQASVSSIKLLSELRNKTAQMSHGQYRCSDKDKEHRDRTGKWADVKDHFEIPTHTYTSISTRDDRVGHSRELLSAASTNVHLQSRPGTTGNMSAQTLTNPQRPATTHGRNVRDLGQHEESPLARRVTPQFQILGLRELLETPSSHCGKSPHPPITNCPGQSDTMRSTTAHQHQRSLTAVGARPTTAPHIAQPRTGEGIVSSEQMKSLLQTFRQKFANTCESDMSFSPNKKNAARGGEIAEQGTNTEVAQEEYSIQGSVSPRCDRERVALDTSRFRNKRVEPDPELRDRYYPSGWHYPEGYRAPRAEGIYKDEDVDARPRTSDGRLMAVVSRPVTAGKTNKGGLVRDVMLKTPFKIRDFQWNMDSWKEEVGRLNPEEKAKLKAEREKQRKEEERYMRREQKKFLQRQRQKMTQLGDGTAQILTVTEEPDTDSEDESEHSQHEGETGALGDNVGTIKKGEDEEAPPHGAEKDGHDLFASHAHTAVVKPKKCDWTWKMVLRKKFQAREKNLDIPPSEDERVAARVSREKTAEDEEEEMHALRTLYNENLSLPSSERRRLIDAGPKRFTEDNPFPREFLVGFNSLQAEFDGLEVPNQGPMALRLLEGGEIVQTYLQNRWNMIKRHTDTIRHGLLLAPGDKEDMERKMRRDVRAREREAVRQRALEKEFHRSREITGAVGQENEEARGRREEIESAGLDPETVKPQASKESVSTSQTSGVSLDSTFELPSHKVAKLIAQMLQHPNEAMVQATAMKTLSSIIIPGGVDGPIGISGGRAGAGDVGSKGAVTTGKHGAWVETQAVVAEAGAVEVALEALRIHHHASRPVRLAGVQLLGALALGNPTNRKRIGGAGGVQAILRAVNKDVRADFSDLRDIQMTADGCLALRNVAACHPANLALVEQERGVELLVSALRIFPESKGVQEGAMGLLNSLVRNSHTALAAVQLMRTGALSTFDVLRRHEAKSGIFTVGAVVEARYLNHQWYLAEVIGRKDDQYVIKWAPGSWPQVRGAMGRGTVSERREEAAAAERLFEQLDVDKNGLLTKTELRTGLIQAGYKANEIAERLPKLFSTMDRDGDGEITKDEFLSHFNPENEHQDKVKDVLKKTHDLRLSTALEEQAAKSDRDKQAALVTSASGAWARLRARGASGVLSVAAVARRRAAVQEVIKSDDGHKAGKAISDNQEHEDEPMVSPVSGRPIHSDPRPGPVGSETWKNFSHPFWHPRMPIKAPIGMTKRRAAERQREREVQRERWIEEQTLRQKSPKRTQIAAKDTASEESAKERARKESLLHLRRVEATFKTLEGNEVVQEAKTPDSPIRRMIETVFSRVKKYEKHNPEFTRYSVNPLGSPRSPRSIKTA